MIEVFTSELKELYNRILNKEKIITEIENFKRRWDTDNLGELYQKLCKKELKKDMGSFYTPFEIVEYMTDKAISKVDYEKDIYIKILDPSCGGGYFLLQAYELLLKKAIATGIEKPEEHILKYNLYGCDTDEIAVMICVIEFYLLTGCIAENIVVMDFLLEYNEKINLIIGNPPYMGHKYIQSEYRAKLKLSYSDVFYDKGDLSYCFIKRAIQLLQPLGKLVFFTSRYLLEALNGSGIREHLIKNGYVKSIIDFYGIRVVKGAGVDNIILEFVNEHIEEKTEIYRLTPKASGIGSKVFDDIEAKEFCYVDNIKVDIKGLSPKGFSFLTDIEQGIINRIRGNTLLEISESYQGIITGCDRAFVVNERMAVTLDIERALLMPWIKNKNIRPFEVIESDEAIIYSDIIKDENEFVNAVHYIGNYRADLERRRECQRGTRKWYELQWGRKLSLFQSKKIVFPYKASSNRFAIDAGHCFSADVYCIKLIGIYEGLYSYEFLVGLLNSSLYEFYIKSFAKKLGDNMYDYYPNKIMELRIPQLIPEIEQLVKANCPELTQEIDQILTEYYNLSNAELEVIQHWCK